MANEIKMPQLSDTMSSGKILSWRKKEGDTIQRGDILAEVETDKANLEIESFFPGTLLKVVIPAGTVATVGDIIAVVGQPGESVATNAATPGTTKAPVASPTSQPRSAPATAPTATPTPQASMETAADDESSRMRVSPLAKKIAAQRNIDLSRVQGSGPNGRIVKRDLENAAVTVAASTANTPQYQNGAAETSRSTHATKESTPAPVPVGGRLTPLSKMRDTIARRMQQSVTEAPHFYVTTAVNMGEARKLREILKEDSAYAGISLNHLIVKAAAYGLSKEPRVNRAMRDGLVYEPGEISVGIITALEDGLLIPVIHNTDKLPLKDLVFEARAAVERARAGRPNSQDLTGGTFSISNLGMFDVDSFTAIINPGQGGVLAVSSVHEEPVVYHGQVVPGWIMKATVSVDHRVIDGVMAGNFLKHFKTALEAPALLMI
jgi:pyruvate dehydrogenase E2 component (dihydrolipoamide acetyltransferase)